MRDGDGTLAGVYEWLKEKNATTPLTLGLSFKLLKRFALPLA